MHSQRSQSVSETEMVPSPSLEYFQKVRNIKFMSCEERLREMSMFTVARKRLSCYLTGIQKALERQSHSFL